MEFSSLEIFCAVATAQGVTRAAQRLGRVQSNITTRVQQLEDELKVELFSRSGKRMALTPSGQRLFEYTRRMLSLVEEARQAVNLDQATGHLRIGALESTAAARLPALLSTYHSRWPRVDLEISIGTSRSLLEDVANGRLDCAFVAEAGVQIPPAAGATFSMPGLKGTRAYTEEMLLVLPPNHPPVSRPEDLSVTTLAAFPTGCTYRNVLERWLGSRRADRPWKVMELVSYHAILACVAAGSCIALCPKSILDLQRVPMDVRTQAIGTIDTGLVARDAYSHRPYEELVQSIQAMRHEASALAPVLAPAVCSNPVVAALRGHGGT
ncbi:MAG TPA: LysR family transcriptional regulator [Paraburkholderia sp.]|nr:LysR family transcriptional regulator [Paraburkholderia sp.]